MMRKLSLLIYITLSFSLFSQTSPFAASTNVSDISIPENVEIRREHSEWLHAAVNEVIGTIPRVYPQKSDGNLVKVRAEQSGTAIYQLFLNQQDYIYPVATKGNVIVKRDKEDGSFIQMKIFLENGAESFLRIFPFQERSSLDVYLFGKRIAAQIPLPFTFEQVLMTSFETLQRVTASRVPWELFETTFPRSEDENLKSLVESLRQQIPRLNDSEDGAMNADGELVFIETLVPQFDVDAGFNCSGFVKWVVDGFAYPILTHPLAIEPLKEKSYHLRGNSLSDHYEDERDPFFGLDWTRNLAVTLERLRGGEVTSPESMDVRSVPYFSYVEDVGYSVTELEPLLFLLAREKPGNFYLGSINKPFGTDPPMRQHTHVVALFPYFDLGGDFKVIVMERNQETSLESLNQRYEFDFIHLVSASSMGNFNLP